MLAHILGRTARRLQFSLFYPRFKAFTMIRPGRFLTNIELARSFRHIPGAIVECGTWKGGMIAGLASALGPHRDYYLFDSYEGLPPPRPEDGKTAQDYQRGDTSRPFHDNCTASLEDAQEAMKLSKARHVTIRKGWFKDTLPEANFPNGIAILRMDGDWYESTLEILDNLYGYVAEGGLILIDDYYSWQGCAKAIHEFLAKHQLPLRIREMNGVCYIVKDTAAG